MNNVEILFKCDARMKRMRYKMLQYFSWYSTQHSTANVRSPNWNGYGDMRHTRTINTRLLAIILHTERDRERESSKELKLSRGKSKFICQKKKRAKTTSMSSAYLSWMRPTTLVAVVKCTAYGANWRTGAHNWNAPNRQRSYTRIHATNEIFLAVTTIKQKRDSGVAPTTAITRSAAATFPSNLLRSLFVQIRSVHTDDGAHLSKRWRWCEWLARGDENITLVRSMSARIMKWRRGHEK